MFPLLREFDIWRPDIYRLVIYHLDIYRPCIFFIIAAASAAYLHFSLTTAP